MLTPRSDDPNLVNERIRRAKDPVSFGAGHEEIIKKQLAAELAKAQGKEETKKKAEKAASEA